VKRKLYLATALLLALAMVFPLAACGGKPTDPEATEAVRIEDQTEASADETTTGEAGETAPEGEEETTTEGEGESTMEDESATAAEGETTTTAAAKANAVPGTPAEVLAAYTAVMNKAKKEAKFMRKLEYEQVGKDSNFEAEWLNNPAVIDGANSLMVTRDEALQADMYINGCTDMFADLPLYQFPVGCMVTDPNVFSKAVARKLASGNIELTMVMKPEHNPEPPKPGATTSPSITGQMFNPVPKSMVDDILNGPIVKMAFWGKPPEIDTKYFDCTTVLVYNPETMQIVTLRQDYNVRIDILSGKALGFINVVGYATAEGVTFCDNFKY